MVNYHPVYKKSHLEKAEKLKLEDKGSLEKPNTILFEQQTEWCLAFPNRQGASTQLSGSCVSFE